MATYQDVRGYLELGAMQSLKDAGISDELIFFDNVGETSGKADQLYAVVSLSFTDTIQDTISNCGGIETLTGSIQCNIYTPRNVGSVPGESAALEVIRAWNGYNQWMASPGDPVLSVSIREIDGPTSLAPTARPHHVTVTSARWTMRLSAGTGPFPQPPVPPGPGPGGGLVTSVFTRIGDVVAQEGDYDIDLLGDVDTSTSPPAPEEMMKWDGTNWVPSDSVDSGTFP